MATKKYRPIDRRVPVSNVGSPLEDFLAFAGEIEQTYTSGPRYYIPGYGSFGNELFTQLSDDDKAFVIAVLNQKRVAGNPNYLDASRRGYSEKELENLRSAAERGEVFILDYSANRNLAMPKTEEEAQIESEQVEEYLIEREKLLKLQRESLSGEIENREESLAVPPVKPAPIVQEQKPQPPSRTEVKASATQSTPAASSGKIATTDTSQVSQSSAFISEEDEEDATLRSIEEMERLREERYINEYNIESTSNSEAQTSSQSTSNTQTNQTTQTESVLSAENAQLANKLTEQDKKREEARIAAKNEAANTLKEIASSGNSKVEENVSPPASPVVPATETVSEGSGAEGSGDIEDEEPEPIEETYVNQGASSDFNPNKLVNKSGDFDLVLYAQSMAYVESRGNKFARSPGGALGLYQFIQITWNEMARRAGEFNPNGGPLNKKGKPTGEATGRYKTGNPDGRTDVDTSTEALISLATGHIEQIKKNGFELTYANLYMYHCASALAPQEIRKAFNPATANVIWSNDTLTEVQRAQWDTQSYWNPHYYYNKVTYKKSREEIRAEVVKELTSQAAGGAAPSQRQIDDIDKEVDKRYKSFDNLKRENPKTWLEIYNKKIAAMNSAVKVVLGKRVNKNYQHTVYVEIPKAMNARGFYKINNGQPVDPSLDEDLVPGAIGRSDGSTTGDAGDINDTGNGNEWWKPGNEISEGERAQLATETRRYITNTIVEAIKRLPTKVTDEEANSFKKYQLQVQALHDQGWKLYEEDLTTFNLFYKEHSLSVICDDSNSFPLRGDSAPIICDFISGTSFNLFKKLPMQGIVIPTAQYLGKQDDTFLVSLRCNGLNAIKQIEVMRDTLKKQAILYKYIPSSFSLKVENNFINAFGNLYFVINGMENSTQPETPGSYAIEMRLTANDLVVKETIINRESTVSTAEIKETFLRELASNTAGLIQSNEAEAYPESVPDACAPNGCPPTEPTTTPADPAPQSMMEPFSESRIHLTIGTSVLGYKDLVYFNEDEVFDWMSAESRFFLQELCAVINLCKCLIIPTGYHYAINGYKLKYPLHKKIIKALYDANPKLLGSSLPVDQPLFWLKRHKGETQYKENPQTQKYFDYYFKSEKELIKIAPPLWDYMLEYEHIEYDISDSILRASAFTSIDTEQFLPYARARAEWARMGNPALPFLPYLAAHRAVNIMSNNTIFNYICDLYWKRPDLLKGDSAAKHFYLNSHFIADKNDYRYYEDWWFTLNNMGSGQEDDFGNDITVLATAAKEDVSFVARKDIKWYLWPFEGRISPSWYETGPAQSKTVAANTGGQGAGAIVSPSFPIRVAKKFQEDYPNQDYSLPFYKIPRIPKKADCVDESLMEYIWNYLIIPYINNALNYENIYLLATETNSFPKTLELISKQIQSKIQPTYNDLMLPKHPYWNEKDANALRGTAFTEPDFYLFNVSTESDFERNSERVEYTPSDNALKGDKELHLSPEAAYNLSIQAEVETRMAEVEGLQQLDYDLNVKNKVIGKDNSTTYGKSVPKASRFEYYKAVTAPKTIIPTEVPPAGSEREKSIFIPAKNTRVEWQEVALMFGENLDLIGSLSANVGKDQKLLNNRVLNYAWQDYDAISAENKIIELRNSYYRPLIEIPVYPGTVAGNNPGPSNPANDPGSQGAPMPDFDWSKQRVLVIGSSSAMGIGDRLGKNLGYENKTAAAYLNIGVGGTAVRHWATNRHKWPTKWHYVDKKDANGNPILHTEGKKKGRPVREKIIDETAIPIDLLEKALSEFRPTVIHIILGANDEAEKRPPDKADVDSILHIRNRLKDYITTWWVGPGSTKFPANPKFRQTIKENWGAYYYDWTTVDATFPTQYLSGDKVHLTPAGSTKWVEVFKELTQDSIFKEGVPADQCNPPPVPAPGSIPQPGGTSDGLPAPAQGDPNATKLVSRFFQFWEEDEEGSGDTSPYMNFSNSRYPTYVKLKDAIKSVNRRKMAGRRAYPVCKVYFIEEDEIYNRDTFELDEIYSYSEVESLEISDSRKRPASVAKITFLDPHGILSGFNQWAAASSPRFLQEKTNLRFGAENQLAIESSLKGVRGSRYEQSDISFSLRAGLKIKICLGFSNDANKLNEVFLGEITDVNLDGSGDRIEVVALSYGAELAAVTKGVTEQEAKVDYNDTFDLLAHLMFEPEVIHFGKKKFSEVTMFGENQSLKTNQIQYKETFSRGGSMNAKRGTGLVNSFLAGWDVGIEAGKGIDLIDGVWDAWNRKIAEADKELAMEPFAGPQDDNIFAPNFLPCEGVYAYDWFGRWQKKISGDYDLRVFDRNSKTANPGYAGMSSQISNVLGAGVAIGGAIGAAALALCFAFGGAGILAISAIFVVGAVLAVGIGILAAAAFGAIAKLGGATFDWATGRTKTAQRENLLDEEGKPKEDAEDIVDSALLIHTYSPGELKYNIFHSTIWDIFQEMTLRHPGYVAQPRIYEKSNRMTMFFGLPDQNMWYTAGNPQDTIKANAIFKAMARDAEAFYQKTYNVGELIFNGWGTGDGRSDGAPNDIQSFRATRTSKGNIFNEDSPGKLTVRADLLNVFLKYVRKRYKPFRRWHNVNSYTDIISNDIEATSQGWFTVVNIQYQYTRWWGSDSAAENAAEDFEGRAKALGVEDVANFAEWDEDRIVKQKANLDLAPNYERTTTFQFLNAKSKGMAKTYGRAKLAHEAKEMYKGSLTIMGSPHIRPYDVIMLNDTYNNMYGPIEVEEIHHIFSPETGYISVIYPDTFIINEDVTPYLLWNGLSADVYNRTEFYMETALAAYPSWGDLQSVSTKGRAYFAQLRDVINAYRQSAARENLEVEEVKDLFDAFSLAAGASTAVSSGILGFTTGSLYATGSVGLIGGGIIAASAAMLGVAAALYASYKLNDIILNYVAETRSYMIVPLMREGIPMVSGINLTSSNGMYKTPLQYMRQYWMDGGQGRALEQTDTLMKYSYMYQRRGGDLNNWLARAQLGWDEFTLDWSSAFHDIPDLFVQPRLFGLKSPNVAGDKTTVQEDIVNGINSVLGRESGGG